MFIPLRIRRETHYYQNVSSSQLDLQIQVISVKIPASYFVSIDKLILKFIWRGKRLRIANSVLKEKNNFGGLIPLTPRFTIKLLHISGHAVLVEEDI